MEAPRMTIRSEFSDREMAILLIGLRLLKDLLKPQFSLDSGGSERLQLSAELEALSEAGTGELAEQEIQVLYQRMLELLTVNAA